MLKQWLLTAQAWLMQTPLLLLQALLIMAAFALAGKIITAMSTRFVRHTDEQKQVLLRLLTRVVKASLHIAGLITALGTIGVDVTALVAGLGLTGFSIGFALKDTLSNVLSGVLIILYQPFKIHDSIKIGSSQGEVIGIDLRYTTLQASGCKILLPNSILFQKEIVVETKPLSTINNR